MAAQARLNTRQQEHTEPEAAVCMHVCTRVHVCVPETDRDRGGLRDLLPSADVVAPGPGEEHSGPMAQRGTRPPRKHRSPAGCRGHHFHDPLHPADPGTGSRSQCGVEVSSAATVSTGPSWGRERLAKNPATRRWTVSHASHPACSSFTGALRVPGPEATPDNQRERL